MDKLIDDSPFLIDMRDNEPEGFKDITVKKLNELFDDTNHKDCIDRIYPIYKGVFPDLSNHNILIQLAEDLHYLHCYKLKDILIVIHFKEKRDDIISRFKHDLMLEYSSIIKNINVYHSFKEVLIVNSLVDLLKYYNFVIRVNHLYLACECSDLKTFKYIWESTYDMDHEYNFTEIFELACRSGIFEKATIIYEHSIRLKNKVNIYVFSFQNACVSGNILLAKWIWGFIYHDKIPISYDFYFASSFENACLSGNLEMVQWVWKLGTQSSIWIVIDHDPYDRIYQKDYLNQSCIGGNLEVVKYILFIIKHNNNLRDEDYKESLEHACRYNHVDIVKYLNKLEN